MLSPLVLRRRGAQKPGGRFRSFQRSRRILGRDGSPRLAPCSSHSELRRTIRMESKDTNPTQLDGLRRTREVARLQGISNKNAIRTHQGRFVSGARCSIARARRTGILVRVDNSTSARAAAATCREDQAAGRRVILHAPDVAMPGTRPPGTNHFTCADHSTTKRNNRDGNSNARTR